MNMKRLWGGAFLVLILVLQFGMLFFEARQESATTDENVHLPAGYTYLKFHDFRLNPEHPPLEKMWSALPLLFQPVNLPPDFDQLWQKAGDFSQDTWQEARTFGEELLYSSGNNADKILLSGRLMTIILTLVITMLVYFWSQKIWGKRGGLVSALLTAFCPLILAHGHLTNTDIGVTLFFLIALWFLIRFLKNPHWSSSLALGIALGLLQLTKYTAIMFFPIALAILIYWLWGKKTWKKELKKLLPKIGLALVVSWLIITLGYFPQIKFFYAPDYIKGLIYVVKHVAGGHSSFLAGQFSRTGWWYYFPLAFLIKTSLITLILLLGLKIAWLKKMLKLDSEKTILVLATGLYLLLSMASRANLGVRHLLPIYPLIFILLGYWGYIWLKLRTTLKILVVMLISFFALDSVLAFPYHLGYFNQLAGGSSQGYQYLLDSNLDWGQELKRIARYQKEQELGTIYLDYQWNGEQAPSYYGIDYIRMTPEMKEITGIVIIGATSYMRPDYDWLRVYPVKDRIGPSVFVIEI